MSETKMTLIDSHLTVSAKKGAEYEGGEGEEEGKEGPQGFPSQV